MAKKSCFVVFSMPVAGREDEYNKWYNEVHLRDVLKLPGFVSARRFKIGQPDPKFPGAYLALYEMDTDTPEKTIEQMTALAMSGSPELFMSTALDFNSTHAALFGQIGETVYAKSAQPA